ncbi:MAG: hypothetical protein ABMA00_13640 [Gemmatimonas sp.]
MSEHQPVRDWIIRKLGGVTRTDHDTACTECLALGSFRAHAINVVQMTQLQLALQQIRSELDVDNARKNPQSGIFQMKCDGCAARALAQSPEFHAAAKADAMTPAYRTALAQLFPERETDGHQLVRSWANVIAGA